MTGESLVIENVGLRHVFEDGISILSGNTMAPERRAYVVNNLWETFNDAKTGYEFTKGKSITCDPAVVSELQTLTLLARFLRNSNDSDWRDKLSIAESVFDRLKRGVDLSEEYRLETTALLGELVSGLKRECGMF